MRFVDNADSAVLAAAKDMLRRGLVEGTAGNTGIGLALVGNARGYRTVVVIPQTQSQEKKDALRLYGAELREVDGSFDDALAYARVLACFDRSEFDAFRSEVAAS